MKINLKITDLAVLEETKHYLESKLTQLSKFIDDESYRAAIANVELAKATRHHRQGEVFRADMELELRGKHFYAAASAENVTAAIDRLKDEMAAAIQSDRGRKTTLVRRGGRALKAMVRGSWYYLGSPWRGVKGAWRYFRQGKK